MTNRAELDKAYELRAEGIAGINDQISTALGKKGSTDAEEKIAQYMEWFLASDVLTARAISNINATLQDESIDRSVPADQFLPDPADRLDRRHRAEREARRRCRSLRGHGLQERDPRHLADRHQHQRRRPGRRQHNDGQRRRPLRHRRAGLERRQLQRDGRDRGLQVRQRQRSGHDQQAGAWCDRRRHRNRSSPSRSRVTRSP